MPKILIMFLQFFRQGENVPNNLLLKVDFALHVAVRAVRYRVVWRCAHVQARIA
jgi:hypothetical protein